MGRARLRFAQAFVLLAVGVAAFSAEPAAAQSGPGAAPDSALGNFLDSLSTETDDYFGTSAAPPDTAGLDSALAYFLVNPRELPGYRRFTYTLYPDFRFNRVDGPVYRGALSMGRARRLGRLSGDLAYGTGANLWLGGAQFDKQWRYPELTWSFKVGGGRETAHLDRARDQKHLRSLRVFLTGRDNTNYYRRDGWSVQFGRETPTTRLGITFRDHLESPRVTTATWSLLKNPISQIGNLPATFGRVREAEYEAAWKLPRVPITTEIVHHTTGQALGSDFDYRRTQVAVSGNFGLARTLAFVPQVSYGHLSGTAIPQAAFFLGGSNSLRSLESASVIGSRMALARVEFINTSNLFEALRIPHPSAFPIQGGVFAAVGAVWGPDPLGGPKVAGDLWPGDQSSWISEVGVAFLYQPGFPDPTGFVRLNLAWGLGPIGGESRVTVSYSRALDFVRPFRAQ